MDAQHSSLLLTVLGIVFFLVIANFSHFLSKKFDFPYTILLVIIGVFLHAFRNQIIFIHDLSLTPGLLFYIFLPLLLFESSFNIDFRRLKKDWTLVSALAIFGVVITSLIIGFTLQYLLNIPIWISLIFGAIISSTDPIAVIAIFKETAAPKRLIQLVESESMFNDGTSVMLAKLILSFLSFGFATAQIASGVQNFFWVLIGSIVFGSILAYSASVLIRELKNEMFIEVTFTFIVAYLSFLIAESVLELSGIISTVASGIILGNIGRNRFSPEVKKIVLKLWEYIAFIANSFVFLLVGITFGLGTLFQDFNQVLIAFIVVNLSRALVVYPISEIFNKSRKSDLEKIPRSWMHLIFWGGLRGALPLAMIISLESQLPSDYYEFLSRLTVGTVLLTLIINGLTIKPLVKLLKVSNPTMIEQIQFNLAHTLLLKLSRKHIKKLQKVGEISLDSDMNLESKYLQKLKLLFHNFGNSPEEKLTIKKAFYQMAFQVEREVFNKLQEKGVITEKILSKLKEKLDEGLDLIESGIFPQEFSEHKIMKVLSKKSKKSFNLKELFLYRKAREFANLEVIDNFTVFCEVPELKQYSDELLKTYRLLIKKNRKMCKDILSGNPEKIKQYEQDLCYSEFLAMEEKLLQDLHHRGAISESGLKVLGKAIS